MVRRLCGQWQVTATDISLISHSENIVYRVMTDARRSYAVRLHRPGYHTLEELQSEQQWTAALNDAGIAVPVGEPLRDGSFYTYTELPNGEWRYAGLVGWLEGSSVWKSLQSSSGPEQAVSLYRTIGRVTADLHNQASGWRLPPGFTRHHLDAEGFMGEQPFWGPFWGLPELDKQQRTIILRVRERLYRILDDLPRSPDQYSMIHADIHGDNLLVNGDELTLIDFDDAGFGWQIYDVAVALYYPREDDRFDICSAFVDGYRSRRKLTDETLALLPYFMLVRNFALIGWMHHRREVDRTESLRRSIERAMADCDLLFPECA